MSRPACTSRAARSSSSSTRAIAASRARRRRRAATSSAVDAVGHDLAVALDVGRDHRHPGGHRLDERDRRSSPGRSRPPPRRRAPASSDGTSSCPTRPNIEIALTHRRRAARRPPTAVGAVASDDQPEVGALRGPAARNASTATGNPFCGSRRCAQAMRRPGGQSSRGAAREPRHRHPVRDHDRLEPRHGALPTNAAAACDTAIEAVRRRATGRSSGRRGLVEPRARSSQAWNVATTGAVRREGRPHRRARREGLVHVHEVGREPLEGAAREPHAAGPRRDRRHRAPVRHPDRPRPSPPAAGRRRPRRRALESVSCVRGRSRAPARRPARRGRTGRRARRASISPARPAGTCASRSAPPRWLARTPRPCAA